LQGTLRVILEPLLVDKPFVGAVTVFFLQKPVSPRDWTGLLLPVSQHCPQASYTVDRHSHPCLI
jgi:hypothetical protein